MGRLHSRAYRRLRDHYPELAPPRLVIAADPLTSRRDEVLDVLGFEEFSTSWADVLAHPDVTVVSMTAPNYLHQEICIAAAEAGKHIWGEKPLGRNATETAKIAAAARANGVHTMIGFNYRHAPLVQHAKQLIGGGAIGDVRRVRGFFLADYAADPAGGLSWRFKRSLAGSGALGDVMVHVVDLLEYLAGPICAVTAQESLFHSVRPLAGTGDSHFSSGGEGFGPVENEDHVTCLARFGSGAAGSLEVGRTVVGSHVSVGFEIQGSHGALSWNFERMNELLIYQPAGDGAQGYRRVSARPGHGDFHRFQPGVAIPMGYDDLKVIEASMFVRAVLGQPTDGPTFDDAARAADVIDGMTRSFRTERWETTAP